MDEGPPLFEVEGIQQHETEKAYLLHLPNWDREEWVPKSQVVDVGERDDNGMAVYTVKSWWYHKAGLDQ